MNCPCFSKERPQLPCFRTPTCKSAILWFGLPGRVPSAPIGKHSERPPQSPVRGKFLGEPRGGLCPSDGDPPELWNFHAGNFDCRSYQRRNNTNTIFSVRISCRFFLVCFAIFIVFFVRLALLCKDFSGSADRKSLFFRGLLVF